MIPVPSGLLRHTSDASLPYGGGSAGYVQSGGTSVSGNHDQRQAFFVLTFPAISV